MADTSDSTDSDIIGEEVEQEIAAEEEPVPETKPKSPKRKKLTNLERLKLIDGFRQGKTDKFYNVMPDKKKPGDYRIVRRRKPLDVPIVDSDPSIDMNVQQPTPQPTVIENKKEKNNKFQKEFYAMQNTINNSLSKEIAAVMEKCNKIEAKLKKQKRKQKEQRRIQQQEMMEYDYDEEPEPEQQEYYEEQQYFSPFGVRRRIDFNSL